MRMQKSMAVMQNLHKACLMVINNRPLELSVSKFICGQIIKTPTNFVLKICSHVDSYKYSGV